MGAISRVKVLTFDLFGTTLDLGGSLRPFIQRFLTAKGSDVSPDGFWEQWRYRQRIEQYQDTIMMLGHSGYLETSRRALSYTLKLNHIEASRDEVRGYMAAWQELSPFPEVLPALARLKRRFKLVVLSNGDPEFLDHLVTRRIKFDFDAIISATTMGAFKPHPAVYRRAAAMLASEVGECMMISSNSFDVVGARACGFRAASVDRNALPYEETPFQPDLVVRDFTELADAI